jgi:hypothetical protein
MGTGNKHSLDVGRLASAENQFPRSGSLSKRQKAKLCLVIIALGVGVPIQPSCQARHIGAATILMPAAAASDSAHPSGENALAMLRERRRIAWRASCRPIGLDARCQLIHGRQQRL